MAKGWNTKHQDFGGSKRREKARTFVRIEKRNRARGWGWPFDGIFQAWERVSLFTHNVMDYLASIVSR